MPIDEIIEHINKTRNNMGEQVALKSITVHWDEAYEDGWERLILEWVGVGFGSFQWTYDYGVFHVDDYPKLKEFLLTLPHI